MIWLQLALIVGLLGVLAVAMRRRRVSLDPYPGIDVGTVSERWLAEQRGRK
jgi:hypothetical protein